MLNRIEFSIPPIEREEWAKLIRGEIAHNFRNYVLQLQIHKAMKDLASGTISEEMAIEKVYGLCQKYALATQADLKQIFKTW